MSAQDYPDLRAAYCAHHGIPPERFERSVFWSALGFHWLLPLILTGGPQRNLLLPADFFARDFEHIRGLGDCRSGQELTQAIEGIGWEYQVEREILRTWFRMRMSLGKLDRLLRPLLTAVRPPAALESLPARPDPAAPLAGSRPAEKARSTPGRPTRSDREAVPDPTAALARLEQVHRLVVQGQAWELALLTVGFNESEFEQALEQRRRESPSVAWLHLHWRRDAEYARLRTENARLARMVADLSLRLAEPLAASPASGELNEAAEFVRRRAGT